MKTRLRLSNALDVEAGFGLGATLGSADDDVEEDPNTDWPAPAATFLMMTGGRALTTGFATGFPGGEFALGRLPTKNSL